jgi:hypothetical protein
MPVLYKTSPECLKQQQQQQVLFYHWQDLSAEF